VSRLAWRLAACQPPLHRELRPVSRLDFRISCFGFLVGASDSAPKDAALNLHGRLLRNIGPVLDDLDVFERYESFGHHLVNVQEQLVDFLLRIDNLDDQR
jgi:hypothetical protein